MESIPQGNLPLYLEAQLLGALQYNRTQTKFNDTVTVKTISEVIWFLFGYIDIIFHITSL